MSTLLRAELLKLRTTRTFLALVASAAALSLLVTGLTAGLTNRFDPETTRSMFTSDASGLFILLLGVMGMAGEWRHRTITSTVLASPDRLRLLAAKVIAYAVAGVVLSLAVSLAVFALGTLILSARGVDALSVGELADVLWRNLLVAALTGAFGVCIGGVIRNQVVAIVGVLVVAFALEPALIAVSAEVGRFGPTNGAPNGIVDTDAFGDEVDLLAPVAAVLVMLAWIAAGFAAAAALLKRRDLV
jgi:ABC-type transport system involved in multi-copper enzyme maturation permease subunit